MARLIKEVVRGNFVVFTSSFLDANGNPTFPANATLTVAYRANTVLVTNSIAMSPAAGNTFTASWDTNGVDKGVVFWNVKSGGGAGNEISEDGSFVVVFNEANPATA